MARLNPMTDDEARQEMEKFELGQLVDLRLASTTIEHNNSYRVYAAYAGQHKQDSYLFVQKEERGALGGETLWVYSFKPENIVDADSEEGRVHAQGSPHGIDRHFLEFAQANRALNICRCAQHARRLGATA